MSMSDLLVETALADLKERILTQPFDDFEIVFDTFINSFVADANTNLSLVKEVWDQLVSYGRDGLAVESAFAPAVYKNAHVIISVVCENSASEGPVLGNGGGAARPITDTQYGIEYAGPVRDTIGVYIMAPNKPVLRLLDLLVKSTLCSAITWMNENGVEGPYWDRTSDLAPITQMVGKETVLKLVRKQSWTCFATEAVRPFGGRFVTPKQIIVHAAGTFVSSVPNPETRTFTPLASTSAGRVSSAPNDE